MAQSDFLEFTGRFATWERASARAAQIPLLLQNGRPGIWTGAHIRQ
ncbi:MAG: hypothetical protein OXM02_12515 [Bacteroidota bacterium]|nr:hypothetical protein [Bacteroidota bacterium]MDE2956680.1 hypothetical protein [Bacteroidota bacterium]